ncbi:MAG: hypothetical protein OXE52_10225 [Chloroflexi bacterium]|nr:hypothetical protein [Chloroflexota bacterium]
MVDAEEAADSLAFNPLAQRASGDGFAAETRLKLVPFVDVIAIFIITQAGRCCGIAALGLDAAIIDAEFFEIGQDADGRIARPAVAAQLKSRDGVPLQVDMRHFGLDEEMRRVADAEAVIRAFGFFNTAFVHHDADFEADLPVVNDIPTQGGKQFVNELRTQFRFAVWLAFLKLFNQLSDFLWRGHSASPTQLFKRNLPTLRGS